MPDITRRDLMLASLPLAATACGDADAAAAAGVNEGDQLPRFNAVTLDGRKLDNESVRGKTLLLQFWATWCGYCRRDQPSVDRVTQEYESKGLIVLAVNVGEDEGKVREYLHEHPRRCAVSLSTATNLQRIFRAAGFPKYVAVNAQGKITGVQDGAGGMLALRELLAGAGLRNDS